MAFGPNLRCAVPDALLGSLALTVFARISVSLEGGEVAHTNMSWTDARRYIIPHTTELLSVDGVLSTKLVIRSTMGRNLRGRPSWGSAELEIMVAETTQVEAVQKRVREILGDAVTFRVFACDAPDLGL